jgi:hypothetical protein
LGLANNYIIFSGFRDYIPLKKLTIFDSACKNGITGKMQLEIHVPIGRPCRKQ